MGETPSQLWREAVAHIGTGFDLTKVERASLDTDGEAQYVNGIQALFFARESDCHIDPFHIDRAVTR